MSFRTDALPVVTVILCKTGVRKQPALSMAFALSTRPPCHPAPWPSWVIKVENSTSGHFARSATCRQGICRRCISTTTVTKIGDTESESVGGSRGAAKAGGDRRCFFPELPPGRINTRVYRPDFQGPLPSSAQIFRPAWPGRDRCSVQSVDSELALGGESSSASS